jgi:hypothetical protein
VGVVSTQIDAFLIEVRNMPGFMKASASDPMWLEKLDGMERTFNGVERLADEDIRFLEIADKMQAVISHADLSTKAKLLEVGRLLAQARDTIKIVH